MRLGLLFAACLLLGAAPAGAVTSTQQQHYQVTAWTTAAGLPQNTVNDILALRDGEIWLATFGGLVRFDGARFDIIDIASDEGLPSNRITALAAAGPNALWFLTQEGYLGRFEHGRARTRLRPVPEMPDVIALAVDGTTLVCLDELGDVWTSDGTAPWRRLPGLPRRTAALNMVAARPAGGLWIGLSWAVAQTDGPRAVRTVDVPRHHALAAGRDDAVYLGLDDGVARLQATRVDRLDIRPALRGPVTDLLAVDDDTLWVAAEGEVSLVQRDPEGTWTRQALRLDMPAGTFIRALVVDREGSLWIGTTGHGLLRAFHPPTRRFGRASGIAAAEAVVSDGRGGAWVAAACQGVHHIDADGAVTLVHATSPETWTFPVRCGLSLAPGPADDVWVRARSGLFRVRHSAPTLRTVPVTLPDEVGPIAADGQGGVWVASRSGRLQHVVGDRVVSTQQVPGPLFSMVVADDGSVWLGGEGAVSHVTSSGVRRFGGEVGVPRGAVRDILPEPEGAWIATYGGGLGVLAKGRVRRLTSRQGLPDNAISRLLDDGRGRVWASTNRGIVVLDRREVAAVLDGRTPLIAPVLLGAERGVPEANFGQPAGTIDTQGRLWFGTIDGVVALDARAFPFNRRPPVVHIEGVFADDRPLPLGPDVAIPAGTSRVRVHFAAGALLYPMSMRYRFRIEGIDRRWVEIGPQRFATWTPSAPGAYRFLLQARNEDGVWADTPQALVLDVQPLWWQTTLARSTAASLVVLIGVALYRWRVGHLERRHAERVHALEERRRTEEEALALRTQLEHVARVAMAGELAASLAHEVNQPLTAIVANAEAAQHVIAEPTPDPHAAQEMLSDIVTQGLRASEVVQGLREFLRSGHPELAPVDLTTVTREMLPLLRREIDQHRVDLELALRDGLPAVEARRVQIGQILVNLVMNACEAMAAQAGERRLAIETRVREDRVELVVTDTGPGLPHGIADRVFDPFVTTKPQGMGMGLAICRSIAEAHRGRLIIEAAPGGGACCVLSLPATPA